MIDTRYRVNAGSVYALKYHLVWCPKYRKRILIDVLEKRLRQLLYQKAKEIKAQIRALEIETTYHIETSTRNADGRDCVVVHSKIVEAILRFLHCREGWGCIRHDAFAVHRSTGAR
jgi:Transposase IS200 like